MEVTVGYPVSYRNRERAFRVGSDEYYARSMGLVDRVHRVGSKEFPRMARRVGAARSFPDSAYLARLAYVNPKTGYGAYSRALRSAFPWLATVAVVSEAIYENFGDGGYVGRGAPGIVIPGGGGTVPMPPGGYWVYGPCPQYAGQADPVAEGYGTGSCGSFIRVGSAEGAYLSYETLASVQARWNATHSGGTGEVAYWGFSYYSNGNFMSPYGSIRVKTLEDIPYPYPPGHVEGLPDVVTAGDPGAFPAEGPHLVIGGNYPPGYVGPSKPPKPPKPWVDGPPHEFRPPGRGERERKFRPGAALARAYRWVGFGMGYATESADVVEDLWWSLSSASRNEAFVKNGYKPLTILQKSAWLFGHSGDIDLGEFLVRRSGSDAGDRFAGRMGRFHGEAAREGGYTTLRRI